MSRARDLADGTFSGAFSADSPTLVVDATNNSVGIGTATPNTYGGGLVVDDKGLNILSGSVASPTTNKLSWWSDSNGTSQNAYLSVINDGATTNTGQIVFYTKNSGGTLAERVRIQAGGGISFNGDTAAANALDDYEEGTWSPYWSDSNGDAIFNTSPTVNFAHYTKVGRYVTACCYFNMPSSFGTTGSYSSGGALRIGGLPFTAYATGSNNYYAGSVGWYGGWSWDASGYGFPPMIYTIHNTTMLNLMYPNTNSVSAVLQSNVYVSSSGIILTATYFTSA